MDDNAKLLEILDRLVGFKTVTGDTLSAHMCLSYAEQILKKSGMVVTKHHSGGFESLVATTHKTKRPKILLQAHLDVVPAAKDMFSVRKEKSRLMGRGVFDMKYAAACFLLLAEELQDITQYDFGIMFTADEESNGQNGVKYLLDQGYGCDVCILPDGGDNWKIETTAKGGLAVKAVASGTSAHGSRPWEGDNAIEKILGFLKQAKKLVPAGSHEDATLVISRIEGGTTHNQVPDAATATLDIRFMDMQTGQGIRKRLYALADDLDIILEPVNDFPPVKLDPTLPGVKDWEQVVRHVRGKTSGYTVSYGGTDARYFAPLGIPCIITRPDGGGHHGDGEWVDEHGVYEFYACIKQYVMTTAEKPVATGAEIRYTAGKLPETVAEETGQTIPS